MPKIPHSSWSFIVFVSPFSCSSQSPLRSAGFSTKTQHPLRSLARRHRIANGSLVCDSFPSPESFTRIFAVATAKINSNPCFPATCAGENILLSFPVCRQVRGKTASLPKKAPAFFAKVSLEFFARRRKTKWDHVFPRHVRGKTYFSSRPCARQRARARCNPLEKSGYTFFAFPKRAIRATRPQGPILSRSPAGRQFFKLARFARKNWKAAC